MSDTERKEFEAWVPTHHKVTNPGPLARVDGNGRYFYGPVEACWKAWQARATLAQQAEREHTAPVGEILEMDDGALVPVWRDGTPPAGTKLYVQPVATPTEREPLTDEQVERICYVGPVYAPNGKVERSSSAYRMELEAARLYGIREAERAHGICKEGA